MDAWEALRAHGDKSVMKLASYPDAYHRHLARFQGQSVTIVEIGVLGGGSLAMWRTYLGPQSRVVGIDVEEACKEHEADGIEIVIGDQSDRGFLERLADEVGPMDVVIDDGGHHVEQQVASFETLYPRMTPTGVYVCEDVHTSYLPTYRGSFVDYAKGKLDELHGWYTEPTDFTTSTASIHIHPSMVVFERAPQEPPTVVAWANGDEVSMPLTEVTTLWTVP